MKKDKNRLVGIAVLFAVLSLIFLSVITVLGSLELSKIRNDLVAIKNENIEKFSIVSDDTIRIPAFIPKIINPRDDIVYEYRQEVIQHTPVDEKLNEQNKPENVITKPDNDVPDRTDNIDVIDTEDKGRLWKYKQDTIYQGKALFRLKVEL